MNFYTLLISRFTNDIYKQDEYWYWHRADQLSLNNNDGIDLINYIQINNYNDNSMLQSSIRPEDLLGLKILRCYIIKAFCIPKIIQTQLKNHLQRGM